ncbi:MAG TPA: hypothetical protein VG708_00490, partial [Mycobacteriales bacterium]|nr:hypothetical protein [Mycobacteriales bacterium]
PPSRQTRASQRQRAAVGVDSRGFGEGSASSVVRTGYHKSGKPPHLVMAQRAEIEQAQVMTTEQQLILDLSARPALRPLPTQRTGEDHPKVSLRMLMAMSGRCCCDDCVLAYRRGDRRAGIVSPGVRHLHTVKDR